MAVKSLTSCLLSKKQSFKEGWIKWWNDITNIFLIEVRLSLSYITFSLYIMDYHLTFELHLPNLFHIHIFKNLWRYGIQLKPYQFFEITFFYHLFLGVDFNFKKNIHCDHAGWYFWLNLFGLGFDIELYDVRHWNDDKNRFYESDEPWGNDVN